MGFDPHVKVEAKPHELLAEVFKMASNDISARASSLDPEN